MCRGNSSWDHGFVPLEKVIIANLDCLFAGMAIESAHSFRVTRNAELDRQEDEADDLLDMIADEVRCRFPCIFWRMLVTGPHIQLGALSRANLDCFIADARSATAHSFHDPGFLSYPGQVQ